MKFEGAPQKPTQEFDDLNEKFSPEEQARLRENLEKQFIEAEGLEKAAQAIENPVQLRKVWDRVGEWVERSIVPSQKKATLEAALVEIFSAIKKIEEEKEVGANIEKTARFLEQSIETFLHLIHNIGPENRAKTSSDENGEELDRLMQQVITYEFDIRSGQFDKAKEPRNISLDDTQEILIPEFTEPGSVGAQESPVSKPEELSAPVTSEKEVEKILDSVPEKEKATWLRKIAGAGFGIQQAKNWAGEQAFGFAYKKFFESAVDAKKQGKELKGIEKARFEAGLLVGSMARHYSEAKDVSEKNKEDFYAGKSKKMEWAKLAGEGVRAARAVLAPMGMLRSPVWTLIALSRISETAKEHRFEKKKYDESSDEVAEDAITMYEQAQKEAQVAGREVPTADDISRVYAKGVIRGTLESGTGALTKTAAGLGVKNLIEPVFKEMKAVEEDASLSASEKQARLTVLARKNEKLIKEVDMLVDRAGSVDAVAYYLRQTGVWTKRISAAVAIETLAEAGYHILLDSIAEGADASHSANTDVSSLKRPFVASTAYTLEHMKDTEGLDLSGVEAPIPPVTIERGGNIWSSAKDIAEKAGLSKEEFAAAWGESTVKLSDGRIIPIAELNLVHEGDTLSYVSGEGDAAGHFEFNNESHIAYGDTLNLPGAQESEVVAKMDFEQEPFVDTVDVTAPDVATLPPGELSEAEVSTEHIGMESPQELPRKITGTPVDRLAEMGIETYSAEVIDNELRWYFGQKYQTSELWRQIQGISARKFEEMSSDDETAEVVTKFRSYIGDLGKKTGMRPIGGLFRRDETVFEYFARIRRILIEQQSAAK